MKKIFTLILTAMFAMGVNAQDFADYASLVGQSYNQLSRQFSDMEEVFEGYYECTPDDGKTESLFIGFNDDLEAHTIMQSLKEDAYTLEQIIAYMDGKYTKYDPVEGYDEETGELIYTTYSYGNTPSQDDATLLITFSGNDAISYSNPTIMPEPVEQNDLGGISPIEAAETFIGMTRDEIDEAYPDVFNDMMGMTVAFAGENDYLLGVILGGVVDGKIASITLMIEASEAELLAYYKDNGYTYGDPVNGVYTITDGKYKVEYDVETERAVVTASGETGINAAKQNVIRTDWYTVDGKRLNGQPAKKGLYIQGGRKVIIK